MYTLQKNLYVIKRIIIHQKHELFELFGYETRNKYSIQTEAGEEVAFAAEQQKGLMGFVFRQLLGHWRTFQIYFFDSNRQVILSAVHPFRFFFQRLEVFDAQGVPVGAIQQRFAFLTKSFDIMKPNGFTMMTVRSGLLSFWTFKFEKLGRNVAIATKKWSGALTELFTDKDKFLIEFIDPTLSEQEKTLIVAAGMFIDLQYFERKANDN
jgi:uncharacterized protein YxjI